MLKYVVLNACIMHLLPCASNASTTVKSSKNVYLYDSTYFNLSYYLVLCSASYFSVNIGC